MSDIEELRSTTPQRSPSDIGDFLDSKELARITGKTVDCLKLWRRKGLGPPYYKLGRSVLYSRSDVNHWFEGQRRRCTIE